MTREQASTSKTSYRPLFVALLCGLAGTVQYHSAQFLSGFDNFFGDRGDARGFVYFCEHWYQSILGNSSLLNPGIFYPTKGALAYSDLLVGIAVPYSLFRALGFGMFSSAQIVIVLGTFLGYCAAFWLLYKVLNLRLAASIIGAMFFAFSGPKFFQTIHLQLQFVVLLPVLFGLIVSFGKQVDTLDQKRAAVLMSLVALCFNLLLATAFYYAWFFVFWAIIFLILALIVTPSRRFIAGAARKFWPALLVSAGVFVVTFIPILLLYLPTLRIGTWYRYDFTSQMIPDWRAALAMGDGNYIWGSLLNLLWANGRPDTWGELQVGIGLLPTLAWIVISVVSVWWLAKRGLRRGDEQRADQRHLYTVFLALMVLATTIFYLIGFKYAGHSPWFYIYQYFPGAGAIRAVARYVIFLTLPMSIAFAYALHKAQERKTLGIAILVLAAIGVFEQFGVNKISGTGFSKAVEESYLTAMAAKLAPDCSAFYVAVGPHGNHSVAEYQYDGMLLSQFSGRPTLNASSSQFPRDWNMYFVNKPDYEDKVSEWIELQKIPGKVCRLETGPEVQSFDPKFPSPIDYPEFFVRQMYRDFTGQEPEAEVRAQLQRLENCAAADQSCSRAQIALNVFLGSGFHERGSFILRVYEAGLGRLPHYDEFVNYTTRYRDYLGAQPPQAAKDRIVTEFIAANNLAGTENEKRLRETVDSEELVRRLSNRSFAALHYYGFLRREPDAVGLTSWSNLLERTGDISAVTSGMLTSIEYRQRFRN